MPDPKTENKKPGQKAPETFEDGLARLEAIVGDLESRSLSLDAAVTAFEEGMRLSDALGKKLSDAEARLETIAKGPEGRTATPMDPPRPAALEGASGSRNLGGEDPGSEDA